MSEPRRVGGRLATALALALAIPALAGCARQQWKFDSLDKRDQLRFSACRTEVRRHLCPDDPDCDVKAAQAYADERPDARLQWLLDHRCPREKIQHVDELERRGDRERIGMPPDEPGR